MSKPARGGAPHTPGPWISHKARLSLIYAPTKNIGVDGRLFTISYNVGFKPDRAERDANASLIAAAPDLLDALREAVDVLGDADWNGRERALAAIAKAAPAGAKEGA